ncbi:hypothetical protein OCO_15600 [Mycobacterium intracellulare MOTT-02]|nr:hypothetical protein OCO_15600 [Mycobacterium intracellulare MOTT-02]
MTAKQQGDAKRRAVEALRGVRKSTAMPRSLQFLTGEAVLLESREPARPPWEDIP